MIGTIVASLAMVAFFVGLHVGVALITWPIIKGMTDDQYREYQLNMARFNYMNGIW